MNREKLRYAILKEIHAGNTPLTEKDFEVTEDEFDDAIRFLSREKYLLGAFWADNRAHIFKTGPTLTEKGEQYLRENSGLNKAYNGLKEIREWLRL